MSTEGKASGAPTYLKIPSRKILADRYVYEVSSTLGEIPYAELMFFYAT